MTDITPQHPEALYSGTTTDLAALIEACACPPDAFFLAERLPWQIITDPQERQDLLRFARVSELGSDLNPARYTSGRIFCQEFELRWDQNQVPGTTHLVYSGSEETWPERLFKKEEKIRRLALTKREPRAYYLFGETLASARLARMGLEESDTSQYYAEVRIPRLLRYPRLKEQSGKRRVQLAGYEYLDENTGAITWFRFRNLQVAELKQE